MATERRKHPRTIINQIAKFRTDEGALPRDCMITDISKLGARLLIDVAEVPAQFHLIISGEAGVMHECRVVWQIGGEVGVSFVGRPQRERTALA